MDNFSDIPKRKGLSNIGKGIDVNMNMNNSGKWIYGKENKWILRIKAPGAFYLGLLFDEFSLPKSSSLYIYNDDMSMLAGPFTSKNNPDLGKYAIEPIKGETIILDYTEPINNNIKPKISISKIMFGFKNIFSFDANDTQKKSLSKQETECDYLNVACPEGNNWNNEKYSTCKIFVGNHYWYVGSGVLLNNSNEDKKMYVLTAEHLLSTTDPNQIEEELETWIFAFNYRTTDCEGTTLHSDYFELTGASFIDKWIDTEQSCSGSHTGTDFLLIELDEAIPSSKKAFFAGYTVNSDTPNNIISIHHPDGLTMKMSLGNITETKDKYWMYNFDLSGVAANGSSGGPVFNKLSHKYCGPLIGYCYYYPCHPNEEWAVGRFDKSWQHSYLMRNKLDPKNVIYSYTNSIDGLYSDCNALVLKSQTISSNKSSCKISAYNVTIANGANVTFNSGDGGVSIYGDFTVPVNTTFTIQ